MASKAPINTRRANHEYTDHGVPNPVALIGSHSEEQEWRVRKRSRVGLGNPKPVRIVTVTFRGQGAGSPERVSESRNMPHPSEFGCWRAAGLTGWPHALHFVGRGGVSVMSISVDARR